MKTSLLVCAAFAAACGNGGQVNNTDDARRAYLGLDASIDKAITLGFAGFNSATSANISPQMTTGTVTGTLIVTGQVDQGASTNKGMRLNEALASYSDDGKITYDTSAASLPALALQLKMIPSGTFTGSLAGSFAMTGDLKGAVTLAISLAGDLQPDPNDATKVQRKPGTTHITGTATSSAGSYAVDITR